MEESATGIENGAAAKGRERPPLRIKSRAAETGGGEARFWNPGGGLQALAGPPVIGGEERRSPV
jgi:hypothetical protein